jgi:GT2 family glycosyltransferase
LPDPDLSILVVSYNTRDLTLGCLRSLYAATHRVTFELIVVDNASHDGSAEAIAAEFPEVRLIALKENVGFARGNNLAAEDAKGMSLLLLNPDTAVLDGSIDKLHAFAAARQGDWICGGRTLSADGSLQPASCWGRVTKWSLFCAATGLSSVFRGSRLFDPESYGGWKRDTVREVDIVTGCLLLLSRDLWRRLGGFDPAFFMYFEDADLCLRAWRSGARCVICPDAVIVHHGGASEKVRADKMIRLYRAETQYLVKHWSPAGVAYAQAMMKLAALGRAAVHAALSPVRGASRDAFATWREIWRRRGEWDASSLRA